MRKEEGATVAASHLPSLSWLSRRQAGPAAFSTENLTLQEDPIKYRKCPTDEKRNKNAGNFQTF
jgi:hypothetical protein